MPITGGPYLTAAFFCERVLREQDGVLSAIRIVDRWNINGPTPTMAPTVIQIFLTVLFHCGIYRGQAQVIITPIAPSNLRLQTVILPVLFEDADDRGAGIIMPIGFPVQEDGTYWFEVAISKQSLPPEVVTFIPMRIVYLQIAGPTPVPPNPTNPV